MTEFIKFCNNNQGFLSAVLSFFTIITSIIAIAVSLHTARLPYRKKLLLEFKDVYFVPTYGTELIFNGCAVEVTNIGNMPISLEYFGLAIKEEKEIRRIYSKDQNHSCILGVGETEIVNYHPQTLNLVNGKDYFIMANEPNGKRYIKTVKQIKKEAR